MKIKIALLTKLFIALFFIQSNTAYAAQTGVHVVERIQISSGGAAYFRPEGLVKWGGTGCPNATYAYIVKGIAAYENILALVMASKLNKSQLLFDGTCSADGRYLLVTYAYLV